MVVRAFTPDIADLLNDRRADDEISSFGLGKYNLSVAFDGNLPTIGAESKVTFCISGSEFERSGEPVGAPVWKLVGQRVERFELQSNFILRLRLTSGDHVDFHTHEESYEAVVIDFGSRDGALVMEVF
jgi:hypothetical protein